MKNLLLLLLAINFLTASAFPFHDLFPRQNDDKETGAVDATDSAESKADVTASESAAVSDNPDKTAADDESGSKTTDPPKSSSKSGKPKRPMVDPQSPPGAITMKTPAATDGNQYYKFGEKLTFVWNYTHVLVSPTALNILAVCSDRDHDQTLTVTRNMSVKTTSIVWDTKPYSANPTSPLAMCTYSLLIYDDAQDPTDAPEAGYLAPYSYPFAMYSPKQPVPLASYECAICENSAVANIDPKLMRMLLGTGLIFIISFFWFARSTF